MPKKLTRTLEFTLKFSNPGKLRELEEFAEEYLWLYGLTLFKLSTKAEQENVSLVRVNPSYTSQRCPVCGHTEKENRKAERFKCLQCGYEGDADHVGALNILSRFYEELEVPYVGGIRDG